MFISCEINCTINVEEYQFISTTRSLHYIYLYSSRRMTKQPYLNKSRLIAHPCNFTQLPVTNNTYNEPLLPKSTLTKILKSSRSHGYSITTCLCALFVVVNNYLNCLSLLVPESSRMPLYQVKILINKPVLNAPYCDVTGYFEIFNCHCDQDLSSISK